MKLFNSRLIISALLAGLIALFLLRFGPDPAVAPRADSDNTATRQELTGNESRQPAVSTATTAPALPDIAASAAQEPDWQLPVADSRFDGFRDWSVRYLAAGAAERIAMEPQGIELAKQRRAALVDTIQSNPKLAIARSIPFAVRQQMPGPVAALLEQPVSATGELGVLGVLPLPGQERETPTHLRTFTANGSVYDTFVYGDRLEQPTKRSTPLWGVALEGPDGRLKLAVAESPIRRVPAPEAAARRLLPAQEVVCAVNPMNLVAQFPQADVLEVGGEITHTCSDAHTKALMERLQDEARKLDRPLAAAGGSGSVEEGDPQESNYTEGRKRYLMMRVAFSNLPTPDITSNSLASVHSSMNVFWRTNSYGHTSVAPLGQGSDIVQINLSNPYATYDDDAGLLRTDVRNAATAQGIDLGRYDFDIIYTASGRPSFGFGGLGYVGGPGSWVVGASASITAHETGHNLGFPHANYWDTGGLTANGPGGNQEYGDPYDVMGGGSASGGTGAGQYTIKFKNQIDWVPAEDFPIISSSGLHRIYAHDNWDARGKRGVRFNEVPNGLQYFLDFRQLYTANPWVMNGVALRWGSRTGSSAQLLDTTPGTTSGKNDAPIVIGRTFSDPASQVHITPIAKGNTYPESIDVQVNFGSFPNNRRPVVTLHASETQVNALVPVTFSVNATDPDGDTLAYYWDFDDNTFGSNQPIQTHSFSSAGHYRVRVEVSDAKGGVTSESVIVRVGAPTTFTISGRALSNNVPIAGVLVKANSSRYAYTDSDGTYTITRLATGSYTVTPYFWTNLMIAPFQTMPIAVGPDAVNVDFTLVPGGVPTRAFVNFHSVWKFRDDGTDQGAAWRATSFDDSAWAAGPGELGYGEQDEQTIVSFGGDEDNKHITTYFRRAFGITNLVGHTNFSLSLLVDDGAVVYLNGIEVFRNNLPAGAVTYTTTASDNVDADSAIIAPIPSEALVEGTNVFAVEVHQSSGTSSDLSFDLSLRAEIITNLAANARSLYVSSPADNSQWIDPAGIAILANALPASEWSLVEFFVDNVKIGEDDTAPYGIVWGNPPDGNHTIHIRGTGSSLTVTSAVVRIEVLDSSALGEPETFITANSTWKYFDRGTALPPTWMQLAYDDSSWSNGVAQLGYGDSVQTLISFGPNSSAKYPAYYFRTTFVLTDASDATNLTAAVVRDDGVRVFLNGVEIFRNNLPNGDLTHLTYALAAVDGAQETEPLGVIIPASLLQDGTNILAAEVHQASASSSDARFGLTLTAISKPGPLLPGVRLTQPLPGANVEWPGPTTVSATVVPHDDETYARVEFYDGATKIGEVTSPPYRLDWTVTTPGAHSLTARSVTTEGGIEVSAPVNVTVTPPRRPIEIIGSGAIWRYRDDGSEQLPAWRLRTFDDSSWFQGTSRLGFGDDGEVTRVNSGPATLRHITTWFRRNVVLGNPTVYSGVRIRLVLDDGAVVYFNGTEVFRNNLAPGIVSFNSLALTSREGDDELTEITAIVPITGLVPGTNIIAVEVHQASVTSDDLGFDLELVGLSPTNVADGVYLVDPPDNARFNPGAPITLSAFANAPGGAGVTLVEYFDGAAKIGEATAAPFAATWAGASGGAHSLTAKATFQGGATAVSPPVGITVGMPPAPIMPVTDLLVVSGSPWRYQEDGTDRGTTWRDPGYNDSSWPVGLTRFGFGLDGERTLLTNRTVTTYYRRSFTVAEPAQYSSILFQMQRDDGAVAYLNGNEIFRSNMPQGPIGNLTLASATANGLDEQTYFAVALNPNGSGLLKGVNVLAVEVHQSAADSSDAAFDLQVTASGNTEARVNLATPAAGSIIPPGNPVFFEAHPWPGAGGTVERVEFYDGPTKLGEATAEPYALTWLTAPLGTHSLSARMVYNGGTVLASGPVSIQIANPVVATNFVNTGASWKYLDTGTDQGTNWIGLNFADNTWSNGVARLGYGDAANTVIRFGPNSNSKYITYYFRRHFVVPSGHVFTNLNFMFQRDDGLVVYLNGRESFRDNMPAGTIIYSTRASGAVSGANETAFFTRSVTITNLPAGTNIIAVEVHQDSSTSSDLGFDLGFSATGYRLPSPAMAVAFVNGNVVISWPSSSPGFVVDGSASMEPPNWQPTGAVPVQNGPRFVVTITPNPGTRFFRLRAP